MEVAYGVGTKWVVIAKALKTHRTEHMVKNRIKTLLKNHKSPLGPKGIDELYHIITKTPKVDAPKVLEESQEEASESRVMEDEGQSHREEESDLISSIFDSSMKEEECPRPKIVTDEWMGSLVDWRMSEDMDSIDLVDLGYEEDFRQVSKVELLLKAEALERQDKVLTFSQ